MNHALCALQEACDYLDDISYSDSDLEQSKAKIQECYDTLNREEEDE
jgi:hypothetical protein